MSERLTPGEYRDGVEQLRKRLMHGWQIEVLDADVIRQLLKERDILAEENPRADREYRRAARRIAELEAEVAQLKAQVEEAEHELSLQTDSSLHHDSRQRAVIGKLREENAYLLKASAVADGLLAENARLKAERDRYKRDAECYASECGDPPVEETELYRVRECLVDAITLADNGIVASRGATMRWREALGPLPGDTTGGEG